MVRVFFAQVASFAKSKVIFFTVSLKLEEWVIWELLAGVLSFAILPLQWLLKPPLPLWSKNQGCVLPQAWDLRTAMTMIAVYGLISLFFLLLFQKLSCIRGSLVIQIHWRLFAPYMLKNVGQFFGTVELQYHTLQILDFRLCYIQSMSYISLRATTSSRSNRLHEIDFRYVPNFVPVLLVSWAALGHLLFISSMYTYFFF